MDPFHLACLTEGIGLRVPWQAGAAGCPWQMSVTILNYMRTLAPIDFNTCPSARRCEESNGMKQNCANCPSPPWHDNIYIKHRHFPIQVGKLRNTGQSEAVSSTFLPQLDQSAGLWSTLLSPPSNTIADPQLVCSATAAPSVGHGHLR